MYYTDFIIIINCKIVDKIVSAEASIENKINITVSTDIVVPLTHSQGRIVVILTEKYPIWINVNVSRPQVKTVVSYNKS